MYIYIHISCGLYYKVRIFIFNVTPSIFCHKQTSNYYLSMMQQWVEKVLLTLSNHSVSLPCFPFQIRSDSYLDLHIEIDSYGCLYERNLRNLRSFQLSHFELSIHMWHHSSNTCIWSIYMFQDFLAANKEATEPRVPSGYVKFITLKVLRSSPLLG